MVEFKGPLKTPTGVPPARRFRGPVQLPAADQPGTPGKNPWLSGLTDFMRNLNDSLTFGGWDKFTQAIGIDPNAVAKTERSQAEDPLLAIAGQTVGGIPMAAAISTRLAKNFPSLAKASWRSMAGNGMLTGGMYSALDDVFREGKVDPIGVGVDAGIGGVLSTLVHGASRVLSPKARVAAAGAPFEEQAIAAIRNYMATAEQNGVKLSVNEAAKALYPADAVKLTALYNSSVKSPKGSQASAAFDANRKPGLDAASREVSDALGPKISPLEVQMAAADAVDTVKAGFRTAAKPIYEKVAGKKVPPTHMKKLMQEPYIAEAAKGLGKDKGKMKNLADELGHVPASNEVAYLGGVKKEIDKHVADAEKDPWKRMILAQNAEQTLSLIDKFAPDHAKARAIGEQGAAAVKELESGPLGQLAAAPSTKAQGNALFDIPDAATGQMAQDAAAHLPNRVTRGVLANRADALTSKDPMAIADLFPTEHSAKVADKAIDPATMQQIDNILGALKAVTKSGSTPHLNEASMGVLSPLVSRLLSYGKGDVVKLLEDPAILEMLGKVGPLQRIFAAAGPVVSTVAANSRKRGAQP